MTAGTHWLLITSGWQSAVVSLLNISRLPSSTRPKRMSITARILQEICGPHGDCPDLVLRMTNLISWQSLIHILGQGF